MRRRSKARLRQAPSPPSFKQKLDEKLRRMSLVREQPDKISLSRLLRDKKACRSLVAELGFEVPRPYAQGVSLEKAIACLPAYGSAVLKPLSGQDSWGVVTLFKRTDGRYRNLMSGKIFDIAQIDAHLRRQLEKKKLSDMWILEELLLSPENHGVQIDDFKFYCFYGEIALILQKRNRWGKKSYKWYDSSWTEVDTGKYYEQILSSLPSPERAVDEMRKIAALSRSLPIPFVRIDTYFSSRGLVVGEITPEPGGYNLFLPKVDRYLGAHYEQAEHRLWCDLQDDRAPPIWKEYKGQRVVLV